VVVNVDDLFMGKFFLSKRRFDMALIAAIDFFRNRIVGNFGNVSMTVRACDASVNAVVVKDFINIIIPAPAVFIDSSHLAMFVAQEAFIFVGRFSPGAEQ
jgi:hypothetical protein